MSILLGHQGVGSGAQCGDLQPPHPVGIRRYRTVENLTRRRIVNPHRNGPRRSGDTDIDVFGGRIGPKRETSLGQGRLAARHGHEELRLHRSPRSRFAGDCHRSTAGSYRNDMQAALTDTYPHLRRVELSAAYLYSIPSTA